LEGSLLKSVFKKSRKSSVSYKRANHPIKSEDRETGGRGYKGIAECGFQIAECGLRNWKIELGRRGDGETIKK
jgi:hypothetical protein